MIDIFYWPTPKCKKVTILIEELEIEFLDINPNNRMPFMIDNNPVGASLYSSQMDSNSTPSPPASRLT